jgi:peptidyl-tRNA hydrolase
MTVFVVHIYDAADKLHAYFVYGALKIATNVAATHVVAGRYQHADPAFYWAEVKRAAHAVQIEPGTGRRIVHCDSWTAHIDEMKVEA